MRLAPATVTALYLARTDRPEFVPTVSTLVRKTRLLRVSSLADALAVAMHAPAIELIVVAQSRPGEFSAADIQTLHACCPLAGLVGVMGAWCEGEFRSGTPWQGGLRVYAAHAPRVLAADLARLAQGQAPRWSMAATASIEDRFLAEVSTPLPALAGPVVIRSAAGTATWLLQACVAAKAPAVWCGERPWIAAGAACGIWDETASTSLADLAAFVDQLAAPVLALVSFPRPETIDACRAAGAAAVLAKPFPLSTLIAELAALTTPATVLPDTNPEVPLTRPPTLRPHFPAARREVNASNDVASS